MFFLNRHVRLSFLVGLALSCNIVAANNSTFYPEVSVGAQMGGYSNPAIGGMISPSIRIGRRHSLSATFLLYRLVGTTTGRQPLTRALPGVSCSYMISPVIIRNLVELQLGVSVAVAQDQYRQPIGYLGYPARLLVGRRVAWFVGQEFSHGIIRDLVSPSYRNKSHQVLHLLTGIRIKL